MKPERKREDEYAGSVSTASTANKLSDFQKQQVCRLIGEYRENAQIVEWLKAEHNISVDSASITYYRYADQHQDAIQLSRAAFNAGLDEEWGASARSRILKLQKLYAAAEKDSKARPGRGECQRILEQMQSECPGLAALAGVSPIQINIPEAVAAGVGLVKDKPPDSP